MKRILLSQPTPNLKKTALLIALVGLAGLSSVFATLASSQSGVKDVRSIPAQAKRPPLRTEGTQTPSSEAKAQKKVQAMGSKAGATSSQRTIFSSEEPSDPEDGNQAQDAAVPSDYDNQVLPSGFGANVSLMTGQFSASKVEFALPGKGGLDLLLSRVYTPGGTGQTEAALSWDTAPHIAGGPVRSIYSKTDTVAKDAPYFSWRFADGSQRTFYLTDPCECENKQGGIATYTSQSDFLSATITYTNVDSSSGAQIKASYKITTPEGLTYTRDNATLGEQITDTFSNKISLKANFTTSNECPSSSYVTDTYENRIHYIYEKADCSGKVIKAFLDRNKDGQDQPSEYTVAYSWRNVVDTWSETEASYLGSFVALDKVSYGAGSYGTPDQGPVSLDSSQPIHTYTYTYFENPAVEEEDSHDAAYTDCGDSDSSKDLKKCFGRLHAITIPTGAHTSYSYHAQAIPIQPKKEGDLAATEAMVVDQVKVKDPAESASFEENSFDFSYSYQDQEKTFGQVVDTAKTITKSAEHSIGSDHNYYSYGYPLTQTSSLAIEKDGQLAKDRELASSFAFKPTSEPIGTGAGGKDVWGLRLISRTTKKSQAIASGTARTTTVNELTNDDPYNQIRQVVADSTAKDSSHAHDSRTEISYWRPSEEGAPLLLGRVKESKTYIDQATTPASSLSQTFYEKGGQLASANKNNLPYYTTYTYTDEGDLSKQSRFSTSPDPTDGGIVATLFEDYQFGRPTRVVDLATSDTAAYQLDEFGHTLTYTPPKGVDSSSNSYNTTLSYDILGRLKMVDHPSNVATLNLSYKDYNPKTEELATVSKSQGTYSSSVTLDRLGRPKKSSNSLGWASEATYLESGQLEKLYSYLGAKAPENLDAVTYFDSYGRTKKIERIGADEDDPKNTATTYAYDDQSLTTTVTSPATEEGKTTTTKSYFESVGLGLRPYRSEDENATAIAYSYYSDTGLAKKVDVAGSTAKDISATYDKYGRLDTTTTAATGITKMLYYPDTSPLNLGGDISTCTTAAYSTSSQRTICKTNDLSGRKTTYKDTLANQDSSDDKLLKEYLYDQNANLKSATNYEGESKVTTAFSFDGANRPISKSLQVGTEDPVSYQVPAYDQASGAPDKDLRTYDPYDLSTARSVDYSYNSKGLLSSLKSGLGQTPAYKDLVKDFTYTSRMSPYRTLFSNATQEVNFYDDFGALAGQKTARLTTGGPKTLSAFGIDRYPTGQIASVSNESSSDSSWKGENFYYDPSGQLSQASSDQGLYSNQYFGQNSQNQASQSPTADRLKTVFEGSLTDTYTYNTSKDLLTKVSHDYQDGQTPDSYDYFSYDLFGNLTTLDRAADRQAYPEGMALEYSKLGQLTAIKDKKSQQTNAAYLYDAFGVRVAKKTSTQDVIELTDFAGNLVATVDRKEGKPLSEDIYAQGKRLITFSGSQTNYLIDHKDQIGTTSFMTDQQGQVACTGLSVSPYAENYAKASCSKPSFRSQYAHLNYEPESGLFYAKARYLDPQTGRFTSPDALIGPTPKGLNRYTYAANDPVGNNDPSGLAPQTPEHWVWNSCMGTVAMCGGGLFESPILEGLSTAGFSPGFEDAAGDSQLSNTDLNAYDLALAEVFHRLDNTTFRYAEGECTTFEGSDGVGNTANSINTVCDPNFWYEVTSGGYASGEWKGLNELVDEWLREMWEARTLEEELRADERRHKVRENTYYTPPNAGDQTPSRPINILDEPGTSATKAYLELIPDLLRMTSYVYMSTHFCGNDVDIDCSKQPEREPLFGAWFQ